jgi:pyruvate/2-oxoglutarate dehydrogenase complex dihydrolipoamide acyltransferase (E2) component
MIRRPSWLPEPASVRRRIAVATWRPSKDGRIYTRMEVDVAAVLAYVEQARVRTGERVTVTHVVGAALGRAIASMPEIRARIVLGRILPLPSCDIGFAVDVDGGKDLAPIKVHHVDRLSPAEVACALSAGASRLRAGEDEAYGQSSRIVSAVPTWAMRPLVSLTGAISGGLGLSAFGQPGFPLGSAFVSNVGSLGLDEGFLAPLPFARVPLYLAIGAVREAAVVVDGAVVVRPTMVLVATADHRLVDGAHAGQMAAVLRELLAHPERMDG